MQTPTQIADRRQRGGTRGHRGHRHDAAPPPSRSLGRRRLAGPGGAGFVGGATGGGVAWGGERGGAADDAGATETGTVEPTTERQSRSHIASSLARTIEN